MPSFPSHLPCQPIVGSFTIVPDAYMDEFQPRDGSPLRRAISSLRTYVYTGDLQLEGWTEFRDLDNFWAVDCEKGAVSFLMADWVDLTVRSFEFVQPPNYGRNAGGIYRAALVLRRLAS